MTPGKYEVTINGICEGFGFGYDSTQHVLTGDRAKLLDVSQWGSVKLHNEGYQFAYCTNLAGFSALDSPDLSGVTNMRSMFRGARLFNQDIGSWDVSGVTDMSAMFGDAVSFNQDIGSWDVSGVTSMRSMFRDAASFNQDISGWAVTQRTSHKDMFNNCPIDQDNKPKFSSSR